MPTIIVIWIAKVASWLTKVLGQGEGGALPGLIAEKLQPRILEKLGSQLTDGCVLITGTNGKTTTTRMVAAAIASDQGRVLVNRAGSNLSRGLVSYLIGASSWSGQLKADLGVFEVDEAAFAEVAKALKPKAVLVLNLFRDQLDRYGELNTLAAKIKAGLRRDMQVVLNADDPLVAWLGLDLAKVSYFGMASAPVKKLTHDYAADSHGCPVCGIALVFSKSYYGHIGHYHCPAKNFNQPVLDVVGTTTKVDLKSGEMKIKNGKATGVIKLDLPGIYNLYNVLAAVSLANVMGIELATSIQRIQAMPAVFGRAETVNINGRQLQLFLVKNPTGYNQVIQAYEMTNQPQPMLMIVNDLIADGRDVSWLWDVAFEDLTAKGTVLTSGTRVYDIALRLKYAGITAQAQPSLEQAIDDFVASLPAGDSGIILPTYTAMLATRKYLRRKTLLTGMNQ